MVGLETCMLRRCNVFYCRIYFKILYNAAKPIKNMLWYMRVMGLTYYFLNLELVLSVPRVVQSSGPFIFISVAKNQTKLKLHLATEALTHLLIGQTNAITDLILKWLHAL